MKPVKEGALEFETPVGKISKKLEVFYNPDKKFDRDLNVYLMHVFRKMFGIKNGLDLLAGTGVRGLRLAKENGLEISLNDLNPKAVELAEKNAHRNGIKVRVYNEEANRFLRTHMGKFDYVDLDPFGPPVKYLEGSVIKLNPKGGVLGITATDSSALCGSYPKACLRKYGSKPLKTKYCHELGLRILIKTVVEAGARYNICMKPLFSYSRQDYFRAYFRSGVGATECNTNLKNIGYWQHNTKTLGRGVYKPGENSYGEVCGGLWLGKLWDDRFLEELDSKEFAKPDFINLIKDEAEVGVIGYYHLPTVFSLMHRTVPKRGLIINRLKENDFKVSRTHFNPESIRTNAEITDFINLFRKS